MVCFEVRCANVDFMQCRLQERLVEMLPSGEAQLSTGIIKKQLSQAACDCRSQPRVEDAPELIAAAQVTDCSHVCQPRSCMCLWLVIH